MSTVCHNCGKLAMQPRVNLDLPELYTKLRSESGPSAIELQHIEDTLPLCDKDYDDYELEVARLQSQILLIQGQQKRLKEYKQALHSLRSPVRKLPSEILCSIFEAQSSQPNLLQEYPWCLQSRQPRITVSSPIRFLPALSASAVCTRWREAALSTPCLWSWLKLEITSCANSSKQSAFTDLLELYLWRSKSCPLDIHLDVSGDHAEDRKILVVTLLLQQAQRWKTLEYSGDCTIDSFIGQGIEFSILEKIVLDVQFHPNGEDLFIFEKAPVLRELQIYNLAQIQSRLLWDQLIQLEFVAKEDPLDQIISLFPNLTDLTIWESSRYRSVAPLTASSNFKRLRFLCILVRNTNADVGLLEHILASFTFPSLVRLDLVSLEGKAYKRSWPKDAFKECMARSLCNITEFVLVDIRISDSDLIAILYFFPSLQFLFIGSQFASEDNPLTSRFFSSLHISDHNKLTKSRFPIVPRLDRLRLEFGGANFDDAAFISMVSSRWIPDPEYAAKIQVNCLRAVRLKFLSRKVDHTVYSPLWYLDRMGMRVTITGLEDEDINA